MLSLPNEIINYILILCDGITRERCTVVCKLFADIFISFENINKKYILNRDPILHREVTLLKFDERELFNVCKLGDAELLKYYLGKDLDFSYGLDGAYKGGHMKIVEIILKKGADDFNYGLHGACRGGHVKIVEILLDKGADNFNRGLHGACYGGHMKIIKFMIEKGADDFNVGLTGACCGGHTKIIKLMIEKGADDFCVGLHRSYYCGDMKIIELMKRMKSKLIL